MKLFAHKIFTHRRIIIIFLLAIFIPSLVAAYLSLSTFPKRSEAVKKLLESNLWISAEAAIKSIEDTLLEYEKKTLGSENYDRLIQSDKTNRGNTLLFPFTADSAGQIFLLDSDMHIIFPETASDDKQAIQYSKDSQNSKFAETFARAEGYEYSGRDYVNAAGLYKKCTLYTSSEYLRAIAYESLGRCLFIGKKYDEADKVYNELIKTYGHLHNKADHPFGITSMFQLYQIASARGEEENSLGILFSLYEKIREGTWLISQPVYDFYITEIESILESNITQDKFPEIQRSYEEMQKLPSPFGQKLLFSDLLERYVIPEIKDRIPRSRIGNGIIQERFPGNEDDDLFMVSYAILPDFEPGKTYYGGMYWDLSFLKNRTIPKILEDLSKDSGLDFRIIDKADQNISSVESGSSPGKSLTINFRTFPLPWKLLASHTGMESLEKSAHREIFLYGFLLAVIVALMLFGAVMIARDISRESETNRLKTEFVNNISHELKTPLTLIRLYGETLQRKENLSEKEKKESYEIITKESERLSHLINNVLDFSRIEMGRKEFNLKKGYLQDVIRDTLESYRYHLEKKGFTIFTDIACDLPEMNFDGESLSSVLINLLSNAMKFSPREKEVTVKLFRDNGNAILQVLDKGIGISKEEIPKIFDRFYQSGNTISPEATGSGLGLTLVKHIAEAHGGRIDVESEVGKGSMFTVTIPLSEI